SRLLDLSNPSVEPTPNNSYLQVIGNNETWVSGVYESVGSFLISKRMKRDWLHTHYIYDFLLFVFGIPLAFWIVYRINQLFNPRIHNWPTALEVAFYIYIVFAALYLFCLFFNYNRWTFLL